jgi:hypothetical protein
MDGGNPEGFEPGLVEVDPLEVELASITQGWTTPLVPRSYHPGDRGREDYQDEAWILEEHGYVVSVVREATALTATYRKNPARDVDGPLDTFVRIYEGKQQADAVALFEEDAADLELEDGYSPTDQRWASPKPGELLGRLLVTYTKEAPVPIIVWSYPGRTQVDAGEVYAKHALELAVEGYVPISQSWAEGRPGAGRVLMIGLFASSIRPKGFLTVTYRLEPAKEAPTALAPDPIDQIQRLGKLRDSGVLTVQEFEAKKAELLARM